LKGKEVTATRFVNSFSQLKKKEEFLRGEEPAPLECKGEGVGASDEVTKE